MRSDQHISKGWFSCLQDFSPFPSTLSSETLVLFCSLCNVNHVFKANQMLFATKTLWHSRLFLNYGHIPASAEFVNRPNLLFPGFMHISLKALDMPSSAPFIGILLKFSFSLGCVQCTRRWYPWNGGIDQCCWNVLLLFLCVLYVWILFHGGSCYPSSLWQHHLSLQRPVCTQIFFNRFDCLFQVSEREYKSEE